MAQLLVYSLEFSDYNYSRNERSSESTTTMTPGSTSVSCTVSGINSYMLLYDIKCGKSLQTYHLAVVYKGSNCGTCIGGDTGLVQSPNFPNDYGNLRDCTYHLISGSTITLNFITFKLEEFYDGVWASLG